MRALAAAAMALVVIACGASQAGPGSSGPRIVRVVAVDFGFEPDRIEVHPGETIRFIFENPTDLPHELFVGSADDQARHAQAHRMTGSVAVESADMGKSVLYVPAHGTGQLEYRFDDTAATVLGCHLVGHWESGMRAEIVFVP